MLNKRIIPVVLSLILVTFLTGCKKQSLKNGYYKYYVTLEGGSGKAGIKSPVDVEVQQGRAKATIIWNSKNYDYMIVDGRKYLNENPSGNSTFTFPVKDLNTVLPVRADTTAMGAPHEIEYKISFSQTENKLSDAERKENKSDNKTSDKSKIKSVSESELKLEYATQFSVVPFEKDKTCHLISILNGNDYLLVPENHPVPANLPSGVTVLQQPLDKTYIVSSPVLDLMTRIKALDYLKFTGTKKADCYIPEVLEVMEKKQLIYAGKYSAPDYEMLYSQGCNFTIENAMIYHAPEVMEKLNELGIPVFVERSSYETHPLGRIEWIKLYGLLYNKEQEASDYFNSLVERIVPVLQKPSTGKTSAFFYVGSTGAISVRMPEDYIAKMISLAGGKYILDECLKDVKGSSTTNMTMEDFYIHAKDSDILIYNYTLLKDVTSVDDLLKKNPLFADFKAVKNGKVYSTDKTFFQLPTAIPGFINDVSKVMNDSEENLEYLKKM